MEPTPHSAELKAAIEARLKNIDQLPPMPALASRLYKMTADPDVDIRALADEISRDPAITAAVIRLSNSAYYKPARVIRSVHEAILTLGLDIVANIVVVIASRGLLKVNLDSYRIEASEMWDHSLIVAELAQSLARIKKNAAPPDVAFTAGLLHDIGKIVLVQYFQQVYRQISLEMEKDPTAVFTDLEERHLGYNHAELGARLLESWNFPPELVEAARCTYHPERAAKHPALASIVHVANMIALSGGVGVDIGGLNERLSDFAVKTLALKENEVEALYAHMPELLEKLHDLRSL